jgi:hypothetical protein
MRQWLRSHLTYANVMVTILAFVVLGGGTALGAYVVSSNSQIGPGTVSGHNPPVGRHSNIISGSINGQDVQDLKFQVLTLKNGWQRRAGFAPPGLAKSAEGVVYFRGAIHEPTGSDPNAFDIPAAFRPTTDQYFPVTLNNGTAGRIHVGPDGTAEVDDPAVFGSAQAFTSLAGASYTLP